MIVRRRYVTGYAAYFLLIFSQVQSATVTGTVPTTAWLNMGERERGTPGSVMYEYITSNARRQKDLHDFDLDLVMKN